MPNPWEETHGAYVPDTLLRCSKEKLKLAMGENALEILPAPGVKFQTLAC